MKRLTKKHLLAVVKSFDPCPKGVARLKQVLKTRSPTQALRRYFEAYRWSRFRDAASMGCDYMWLSYRLEGGMQTPDVLIDRLKEFKL